MRIAPGSRPGPARPLRGGGSRLREGAGRRPRRVLCSLPSWPVSAQPRHGGSGFAVLRKRFPARPQQHLRPLVGSPAGSLGSAPDRVHWALLPARPAPHHAVGRSRAIRPLDREARLVDGHNLLALGHGQPAPPPGFRRRLIPALVLHPGRDRGAAGHRDLASTQRDHALRSSLSCSSFPSSDGSSSHS